MPAKHEHQVLTDELSNQTLTNLFVKSEDRFHSQLLDAMNSDSDSSNEMRSTDSHSDAGDESPELAILPPSQLLSAALSALHSQCYLYPRGSIIKPNSTLLRMVLDIWRHEQPDIFHIYLCVTPAVFDALVEVLSHNSIFYNSSDKEQIAIADQVAITLYHLGHFGNAASTAEVQMWCGYSRGTVHLASFRVIAACCSPEMCAAMIRMPPAGSPE